MKDPNDIIKLVKLANMLDQEDSYSSDVLTRVAQNLTYNLLNPDQVETEKIVNEIIEEIDNDIISKE